MKITLAAATILLSVSTAFAADVVYEAPAAPVVDSPVYFSWSGAYAGLQGGYSWTKLLDHEDDYTFKYGGADLGGFVGYNHQFDNNLVLGLEGEINYNFAKKNARSDFLDTVEVGNGVGGSVRARLGYAFDRTLIYATGGWATQRVYQEDSIANEVVSKDDVTFSGYTVGAGVEHAFTDNLFGRVEYRYNDFGKKNWLETKESNDTHAVKVGLGVKF